MADRIFDFSDEIGENLLAVRDALEEKGYDAVSQMTGFILSGDLAYITAYNGAKSIMKKTERDEMVMFLLKSFFAHEAE